MTSCVGRWSSHLPQAKVHLKLAKQNNIRCSPNKGAAPKRVMIQRPGCMLLVLLQQARATYWKYDSFKDDLIIFKINFFSPCKFREHVWWIGERKGSQSGHFLGVSLTLNTVFSQACEMGRNGRPTPPQNLKGASSVPVSGSQTVTFSSTGEEKIASSLLPE